MTILRPNNNLFCTYFLTFVILLIQKKLLMKQKVLGFHIKLVVLLI